MFIRQESKGSKGKGRESGIFLLGKSEKKMKLTHCVTYYQSGQDWLHPRGALNSGYVTYLSFLFFNFFPPFFFILISHIRKYCNREIILFMDFFDGRIKKKKKFFRGGKILRRKENILKMNRLFTFEIGFFSVS